MGSRRFEITETAGSVKGFYVVVDRETGVNYLVAKFGTGGGICPLIDKDGKPGPLCTKLYNKLRDIQYGDEPDTHGWVTVVE